MINYTFPNLSSVTAASSLAQGLVKVNIAKLSVPSSIPAGGRHHEQIQQQLICWVASHSLDVFQEPAAEFPVTITDENPMEPIEESVFC